MSGICGVLNFDERLAGAPELRAMSAAMAHRGVERHFRDASFGCAVRDWAPGDAEAPALAQVCRDDRWVIAFDGRLDNRDDLLARLGDHHLRADTPDENLALSAYARWGEAAPDYLLGDFALAAYQTATRMLCLARDAMGVRPLYYQQGPTHLLFGTEVKALLAHPEAHVAPCDACIADFYFNALMSEDTQGLTVFDQVFSVLPGHQVVVRGREARTRRYWDFDPGARIRLASPGAYAEAFREHFEQAVSRRLRSAAPVGVSLSGGVDSSSIFCVAEHLRHQGRGHAQSPVGVTYTPPPGSKADEEAFLRAVEVATGLQSHRFPHPQLGMVDEVDRGVWHVEVPSLDMEWTSDQAFNRFVRSKGVRVLLSGDWGDQFLADDGYLLDLVEQGAWREAWRQARGFGEWLSVTDASYFTTRLLRGLVVRHLPMAVLRRLRRARQRLAARRDVRGWYTDAFRRSAERPPVRVPAGFTAHGASLYREARSRYAVFCLEWHNKAGAIEGLEHAFPFLDRDLVAFLMAIPGDVLCAGGVPKALLRESLRGVLPEAIASRRTKVSFTSLVNDGVSRDYNRIVSRLAATGEAVQRGYVRAGADRALREAHAALANDTFDASRGLTDVLALEVWLQQFFGPMSTVGRGSPSRQESRS